MSQSDGDKLPDLVDNVMPLPTPEPARLLQNIANGSASFDDRAKLETSLADELITTGQLRGPNESYDDLWEIKSEQLGKLDDELPASGEDPAAVIAHRFEVADDRGTAIRGSPLSASMSETATDPVA